MYYLQEKLLRLASSDWIMIGLTSARQTCRRNGSESSSPSPRRPSYPSSSYGHLKDSDCLLNLIDLCELSICVRRQTTSAKLSRRIGVASHMVSLIGPPRVLSVPFHVIGLKWWYEKSL